MNEGNSVIFVWVKTIASELNLIKCDEKNLLSLLYDDEFIFQFFCNLFTLTEDGPSECIIDTISSSVVKYFEQFYFSRLQLRNIQSKIFDKWSNKEAKFKIWSLFFTLTYLNEFCYHEETTNHKSQSNLSHNSINNFNNLNSFCKLSNIPTVCKPRFLAKSPMMIKSIMSILNEILNEIEVDFFDFQNLLTKLFHKETLNETVFYADDDLDTHSKKKCNSEFIDGVEIKTPICSGSHSPLIPSTPVKNNGSPNLSITEDNLHSRRRNEIFTYCEECDLLKLKVEESKIIITNLKERISKQEDDNKSLLNYNSILMIDNKEMKKLNDQLKTLRNHYEKQIENYDKDKKFLDNIFKEQIETIEYLEEEKNQSKDYKQLFTELRYKFENLLRENSNLKSNLTNFQNVHIRNLNVYSLEKKEDISILEQELNSRNEIIKSLSGNVEGKDTKIQLLTKRIENENNEIFNLKLIIILLVFLVTCLLNWNNK
jgi:hypothetical protein